MVFAFIGHCLVDPPGLFGQMVNGPPVQHFGIPLELSDSIPIEKDHPPTIETTPPELKQPFDTPPPAPVEAIPPQPTQPQPTSVPPDATAIPLPIHRPPVIT